MHRLCIYSMLRTTVVCHYIMIICLCISSMLRTTVVCHYIVIIWLCIRWSVIQPITVVRCSMLLCMRYWWQPRSTLSAWLALWEYWQVRENNQVCRKKTLLSLLLLHVDRWHSYKVMKEMVMDCHNWLH